MSLFHYSCDCMTAMGELGGGVKVEVGIRIYSSTQQERQHRTGIMIYNTGP